jgi:hypothetical protein
MRVLQVDRCGLQVIYAFDQSALLVYVGWQMEVLIDGPDVAATQLPSAAIEGDRP